MSRPAHDNFLMTAEHIGAGVPHNPVDLDTPAWQGYDVLTHIPPEREWVDRLHDRGIKAMPYLTLTYQYIGTPTPVWAAGETAGVTVDVGNFGAGWDAGQTPDAVIIDQLGRPQLHTNYLRHDGKMIYEICPNTRKARDLYLQRAEQLMQCGADGLFLDNASPARRCWGPEFGIHRHIHAGDPAARAAGHTGYCYPKAARKYRHDVPVGDEEQNYATAMLIAEIRDLVVGVRTQNRIMINAGDGSNLPPLFFDQVDSVMNEMFIYHTYLDFNFPSPTHLDFSDHTPQDWLNVLAWQEQFVGRGVRMNTLPAFSAHDPDRRRHALFAFCAAKLWDALPYTTSDPSLDAWVRRYRLGAPLEKTPGSWGAALYREYEHGLVLINPYGIAQQATVPWTNKPADVVAHGDARGVSHGALDVGHHTLTLKLGPDHAALIVPA